MTAMKDTLIIDNRVVQTILTNAKLLVSIPSLGQAARSGAAPAPKKKCGSCGSGNRAAAPISPMSVKRAIVALPADKLLALKLALGARRLRVQYTGVGGSETNVLI